MKYVVSYFDLRSREGFDMIERILSKLIRTLSVNGKRKGTVGKLFLISYFGNGRTKRGTSRDCIYHGPGRNKYGFY